MTFELPKPQYVLTSMMGNFISFRSSGFNHKKGDGLYTADQMRAAWAAGREYGHGDTIPGISAQARASEAEDAAPEQLTGEQVCNAFDALSAQVYDWNAIGSANAAWHAFKSGVRFAESHYRRATQGDAGSRGET